MKYIFIRLQLIVLSPIFPPLLTFILLIVHKIYFDPFILCDDGDYYTLSDLKTNLTKETANYHVATLKIEEYNTLQNQLKEISTPRFRNFTQEELYTNKLSSWQIKMIKSLNNIRQIEYYIKSIDPGFKSSISHNSYSNFGK